MNNKIWFFTNKSHFILFLKNNQKKKELNKYSMYRG